MESGTDGLTDKGKLLFGAGFVFGVMVTMLMLVVVLVVAVSGDAALEPTLQSSLLVTIVAGIVFAAIVGAGLYFLAFPENRTKIPVDPEQFDRSGEE
jgi:hypothetical protein